MYVVYALVDPRDREPRYIGCTDDPYRRFVEHVNRSGSSPTKDLWIAELKEQCYMVMMETLELVEDREEALDHERWWIIHYQKLGKPLFNINGADEHYKPVRNRIKVTHGIRKVEPQERVYTIADAPGVELSALEYQVLELLRAGEITTYRTIAQKIGCKKDKAGQIVKSLKDRGLIKGP